MSARSASELDHAELASRRRVRVPGTARTYEVRHQLRGLGLRWDPATHAWHGTIRAGEEVVLERGLRVRAQVVHPIEAFATEAPSSPPVGPRPPEPRPRALGEPRGPPRDGSRTRAEAQTAYREADELALARRLRDLRGRVKAARAALAREPGAADATRGDWRKEAGFLARFGLTQEQFRNGVARPDATKLDDVTGIFATSEDLAGGRARSSTALPTWSGED